MKCEQCKNVAEVKFKWPDSNTGKPREITLCGCCGAERWEWIKQNANGTSMYQNAIFESISE